MMKKISEISSAIAEGAQLIGVYLRLSIVLVRIATLRLAMRRTRLAISELHALAV